MPRAQDWEIMDIVRKQMLYKCFGIEGSKICDSDFYLNASISSIHTSSNGQYSCPFIFSKHEGYPQGYLSDVSKRFGTTCWSKGSQLPQNTFQLISTRKPISSREVVRDSSEWKWDYKVFQTICWRCELSDIDLFASRISHHVPTYMSWKLDPFSKEWLLFK